MVWTTCWILDIVESEACFIYVLEELGEVSANKMERMFCMMFKFDLFDELDATDKIIACNSNDPFSRFEQQTLFLEKLAEATDPTTDHRRVSFQNT